MAEKHPPQHEASVEPAHPCDDWSSRMTIAIAYHTTPAEIEGDFWLGTCFADSREASLGYLRGVAGWLYTVEITAQWTTYDNDLVDGDDGEELLFGDDWELVCFTGGLSPDGVPHVTYLLLDGAAVRILAVERVEDLQGGPNPLNKRAKINLGSCARPTHARFLLIP